MTIRNNGQKRDTKRILSSLFLLIIGLICLYISFKDGLRFSWLVISAAVLFLSVRMFASSNEV